MKILVIGSKGFIGSFCCRHLKEQPLYEVFGADVAAEYNDPRYFLIDASNHDFREIFKKHKFDICINCAGAASVPDSFKYPLRDYLLNVHHLVMLLNAIREENPACRLLQLSSAAVYGNPKKLPIAEDHPLSPVSPYGLHKLQAEQLCQLYHDQYQLSISVLRIFSAYGAGLQKQLFWDLHKKAGIGELILHGTGGETREFIHVQDIARAIDLVIRSAAENFSIINVANSSPVTIAEAAAVFLEKSGFSGKLSFNGITRAGDPLYWHADTLKLKALGYQPQVTFGNGINDYCQWLKEKE